MNEDDFNEISIEKIYIKDLEFRSPQTPEIFITKDLNPELELELSTESQLLDTDVHEVTLIIAAQALHDDEPFFEVRIEQSGIFVIEDATQTELHQALGAYCPTILFPYAREAITGLVQKAGLPALYLAPVDFEAIYKEEMLKNGHQVASEAIH